MRAKWTKEEELKLKEIYKNHTPDELATILNKTRDQIIAKCQRNHYSLMNYWTKEEDEYIKNNYLLMSYESIGKDIGRTKSAVQGRCRKLGLIKGYRSFKKELNSNYFDCIDTEEKAYWLGFISADGCVSWNKNSKSYTIKITLQESDSDFLKKFIVAIDGKFDLKIKSTNVKFDGKETKTYGICEVSFKDKKMATDLLKYFSLNKTEYLRIPNQIPKNLLRHYIRGFSDGDGCFYCNLEKRNKSFEIVGKSYDMLNDIKDELFRNGIQSSIFKKRQTNWKLGIYRIEELIKLQSYLYKDATIFMERKFVKSQEILKLAS